MFMYIRDHFVCAQPTMTNGVTRGDRASIKFNKEGLTGFSGAPAPKLQAPKIPDVYELYISWPCVAYIYNYARWRTALISLIPTTSDEYMSQIPLYICCSPRRPEK